MVWVQVVELTRTLAQPSHLVNGHTSVNKSEPILNSEIQRHLGSDSTGLRDHSGSLSAVEFFVLLAYMPTSIESPSIDYSTIGSDSSLSRRFFILCPSAHIIRRLCT